MRHWSAYIFLIAAIGAFGQKGVRVIDLQASIEKAKPAAAK